MHLEGETCTGHSGCRLVSGGCTDHCGCILKSSKCCPTLMIESEGSSTE